MFSEKTPWLNFSSFEITSNLGGSLNPLGFQSTQVAIANILFPQFTTLTQNARSHAILCGLFVSMTGKSTMTSEEIRRAENLWGLLQTYQIIQKNKDVESPLNIERYSNILSNSLKLTSKELMTRSHNWRFGYGLHGFYIQPSVKWGLIENDGKKLTDLGLELGKAFNDATGFGTLMAKWLDNKTVDFGHSDSDGIGVKSKIGPMEKTEKAAWRKILDCVKKKQHFYPDLWDQLPNLDNHPELIEIKKRYKKNSTIVKVVELQEGFNKVTAFTNFYFDLFYNFAQNKDKLHLEAASLVQYHKRFNEDYKLALKEYHLARANLNLSNLPEVRLFREIDLSTYDNMKRSIISHHYNVQKMKHKSAFLDEKLNALQFGQMNLETFKNLSGDTLTSQEIIDSYSINWRYLTASNYKKAFYRE